MTYIAIHLYRILTITITIIARKSGKKSTTLLSLLLLQFLFFIIFLLSFN